MAYGTGTDIHPDSLTYQQDEIRSYCQEQGWNLQDIFTDEGISGAKVDEDALEVDRIGFQSMLATFPHLRSEFSTVISRNILLFQFAAHQSTHPLLQFRFQ